MSRFSGSADLYDFLYMHTGNDGKTASEEYRRKVVIYVGNEKIRNECDKDLVPYYPFVGSFGAGPDGATFRLPVMSEVDWCDYDILVHVLASVNCAYRKMVRKKLPKTADQIVEIVGTGFDYLKADGTPPVRLLAERKIAMGRKADLPRIPEEYRLTHGDHYRKELEDEMVRQGYSEAEAHEWCFKGRRTWK